MPPIRLAPMSSKASRPPRRISTAAANPSSRRRPCRHFETVPLRHGLALPKRKGSAIDHRPSSVGVRDPKMMEGVHAHAPAALAGSSVEDGPPQSQARADPPGYGSSSASCGHTVPRGPSLCRQKDPHRTAPDPIDVSDTGRVATAPVPPHTLRREGLKALEGRHGARSAWGRFGTGASMPWNTGRERRLDSRQPRGPRGHVRERHLDSWQLSRSRGHGRGPVFRLVAANRVARA